MTVPLKQLAQSGAVSSDVMHWNGTLWVPTSTPRFNACGVGLAPPAAGTATRITDTSTASVQPALFCDHKLSSGTAAAGIGAGVNFRTQNDAGGEVTAGQVACSLLTVTAGSEAGAISLSPLGSGSISSRLRVTRAGVKIGNATGSTGAMLDIVQPPVATGHLPSLKLTQPAHTGIVGAYASVNLDLDANVLTFAGPQTISGDLFAVQIDSQSYESTGGVTNVTGDVGCVLIGVAPGLGPNVTKDGEQLSLKVLGRVALENGLRLEATNAALDSATTTATNNDVELTGGFGSFSTVAVVAGQGGALGLFAGNTADRGTDDEVCGALFWTWDDVTLGARDGNVGIGVAVAGVPTVRLECRSDAVEINDVSTYFPNGNEGAPALAFGSAPTKGLWWNATPAHVETTAPFAVKSHAAFAGSPERTDTFGVQTTDATVTSLATVTLADNTVYWFNVRVAARDTGGTKRAAYVLSCMAYRQAAGVATLGAAGVQNDFTDETTAAWLATIDVSGNDLRVRVTGEAATTINWVCTLERQGVSGAA